MSLNYRQYHELILIPTLARLEPEVPLSVVGTLLTNETLWHESALLTCIAQYLGNGSVGAGAGICSMERPTFDWLWPIYGHMLLKKQIAATGTFDELYWNFSLAVAMCRLRYRIVSKPLPPISEGLAGRARYWGKHYQTESDPDKMKLYIEHARMIPRFPVV